MNITKSDILLYTIDELKNEQLDRKVTLEIISSAIQLSPGSLKVSLSRMASKDLIKISRKKYDYSYLSKVSITETGKKRLKELRRIFDNLIFTPQRHKVPTCFKYTDIANKLRNPLERAFLLYLYKSRKSFNLMHYIGNLATATNDMNLINFLRKLDMEDEETVQRSYLIDVFNMTLHGDGIKMIENKKGELQKEDIDGLLIHAETLYKQGKMDTAEMIYTKLLSIPPKITLNQWLQTNLGMAQVIRRKKGPKDAIEYLDRISAETKGKLFRAIILQAKGTCYGMLGEYPKAINILTASVRSFLQYKNPLLASICLNNRGVAYFCVKKFVQAEKDWKKAMIMANKAKSNYIKSKILCNLSDIEIKKKNYFNAERLLRRAERLGKLVNDFEIVAAIEFNRALKSISQKDFNSFKNHFKSSEEIAYPLPPEYERIFRRRVLLERAEEEEFVEVERFLKGTSKC